MKGAADQVMTDWRLYNKLLELKKRKNRFQVSVGGESVDDFMSKSIIKLTMMEMLQVDDSVVVMNERLFLQIRKRRRNRVNNGLRHESRSGQKGGNNRLAAQESADPAFCRQMEAKMI